MRILLVLIFAPLIALALMYFVFPGRLVAIGRWLLRKRGGTVQKSVTVDGRTWPYLEGGDPSKPTLLLVHGFFGGQGQLVDGRALSARLSRHRARPARFRRE
jgi:abhydrolase domain-containing protein 6